MVKPFRHLGNSDLIFGNGKYSIIPDLLQENSKVLVITGKHFLSAKEWKNLKNDFKNKKITFIQKTVHGEPSPRIIDSITQTAKAENISAVLSIGGGSVLDSGKAVAAMFCSEGSVFDYLEGVGSREPEGKTLYHIAVPTTAGTGSEATKNAVISEPERNGYKKSLRHDAYIPKTAIIDPALAAGTPHGISLSSGLDAFTQLLESFLSTASTPMTEALAKEGIIHFARGSGLFSEKCYGESYELKYREELALAAYLSGLTLANAGLGNVHGIAGPLGAVSSIPHGIACGLLIAPVFRKISERLKEEEDTEFLDKLAFASSAVIKEDFNKAKYSDIQKMLEKVEKWSAYFPKLSHFGITAEMLPEIAKQSGNKNSPVIFSSSERLKILHEIL